MSRKLALGLALAAAAALGLLAFWRPRATWPDRTVPPREAHARQPAVRDARGAVNRDRPRGAAGKDVGVRGALRPLLPAGKAIPRIPAPDREQLVGRIRETETRLQIEHLGPGFGTHYEALQLLASEILSRHGLEGGLSFIFEHVVANRPWKGLGLATLYTLVQWSGGPDNPLFVRFMDRLLEEAPWVLSPSGEILDQYRASEGGPGFDRLQYHPAIARLMGLQSSPEAEQFFRRWIPQPKYDLTFFLFGALGQGKLPYRLDLLLELKPAEKDLMTSGWLSGLGACRDPRALPILEKHQEWDAIEQFPHRDVIPYLERQLESKTGVQRHGILQRLGRMGVSHARAELIRDLRDTDPKIQASAASCLSAMLGGWSFEARDSPDRRERIIRRWELWYSRGFDPAKKPRLNE